MKKYWIDNECMIDFIEMYCEGKSFLWRCFFGWRKTSFKPNGGLALEGLYYTKENISRSISLG